MKRPIKTASRLAIFCALFEVAATSLRAQSALDDESRILDLFMAGKFDVRLNNGLLFSPYGEPASRPTINYTLTGLEFGYMLSDRREAGIFSGNLEASLEVFGSALFYGPGAYVTGFTLWGRYNFVPLGWRLIPYAQGGAGVTSTDIDHSIDGQMFNFNLNLAAGVRYLITEHWSVSLEYRYQHISNANLGSHNLGINSQGPVLGISFAF